MKQNKRLSRMLSIPALAALILCFVLFPAYASSGAAFAASEPLTTNSDTGYSVFIQDDADLLTPEEEARLAKDMQPLTAYGDVMFLSHDNYNSDSDDYARDFYHSKFGTGSGTMFMIDMARRNITIFSDGEIYKTINRQYALTIVDNVYRYASDGDYYTCASKAYAQMTDLLANGHILQPMKIICTALLSLTAGFLVTFAALRINRSRIEQQANSGKTGKIRPMVTASMLSHVFVRSYTVSSSSGGGSHGGGGGFSGGGGGGGSSGGGGSHGF